MSLKKYKRNFPVIILSNPQLGRNIGSIARVMNNFCFQDLRIINPRDGWPNEDAKSTAAGAKIILKNTKIFSSIKSASNGINLLFSATARSRDLNIREITINEAITKSISHNKGENKSAFLFGPENSGLSNDEIVISDYTFSIPVNPEFTSLNLSHAVMVVCWEYYKNIFNNKNLFTKNNAKEKVQLASIKEKEYFFSKLNEMLDKSNFFHSKEMNISIMKNMKALFNRSSLTTQEINTLNGIIKSLFEHNNRA